MTRQRFVIIALIIGLVGMFFTSCSDQTTQPVNQTAAQAVNPSDNPAGTIEKTTQRSIMDFVNAQGITKYFVPPVHDFMGWGAPFDDDYLLASVDYAGVTDRYLSKKLGTTFSGTVTERSLPDGRAEVKVNLHTRKTLMYILKLVNGDFATDPLLFGNRAHDVEGGAEPALCDSHFEIVFINTAPGAPLPDIMWALYGFWIPGLPILPPGYDPWPGFEPKSLKINATADGPLQALAGLGPYGTPGHGKVVQVTPYGMTKRLGFGNAWPVEKIDYKKRP